MAYQCLADDLDLGIDSVVLLFLSYSWRNPCLAYDYFTINDKHMSESCYVDNSNLLYEAWFSLFFFFGVVWAVELDFFEYFVYEKWVLFFVADDDLVLLMKKLVISTTLLPSFWGFSFVFFAFKIYIFYRWVVWWSEMHSSNDNLRDYKFYLSFAPIWWLSVFST